MFPTYPLFVFVRFLSKRAVVFVLAFLSFACLLGHFYGLWTMRFFGCWVLPPATVLLMVVAYGNRHRARGLSSPYTWVVQGAIGGVVAAVAYDLYRLPFVLGGAPLFNVFSQFGALLLGASEPRWLVYVLGWAYHFSNGAALGIMFVAAVTFFRQPNLFRGAIVWAMAVEVMLLLTPYATFFGLKLDARFLFLTISAHLVFGLVLGWYCQQRIPRRLAQDTIRTG
jgi:hypothetical protein